MLQKIGSGPFQKVTSVTTWCNPKIKQAWILPTGHIFNSNQLLDLAGIGGNCVLYDLVLVHGLWKTTFITQLGCPASFHLLFSRFI